MKPKVIAVIPAYNEGKRIGKVVKGTKRYVNKVIVIDDASKDDTYKIAKKAGALTIKLKNNRGVGFATKAGLKKAISLKPDIIVFLDGDGQHNPKYIPSFIGALKKADYVYGRRDMSNYPINRKIGNFGLTLLTNLFCPIGIMDTECGFRALSLKNAKKIKIVADTYGREMDFAYSVWKNNMKVQGISVRVPEFYSKPAIIRGFKNFLYLLKRRFSLI